MPEFHDRFVELRKELLPDGSPLESYGNFYQFSASCRVLRTDGNAFPNLLAAGGAARGVSGNAVWGYLSGNGLLSAIAGGYIAAHSAATG